MRRKGTNRHLKGNQRPLTLYLRKRGLGTTALCINGKIFAMLSSQGQLIVKLPKERVDALISADQGAHLELSHGQPMHEWFVAGAGLDEEWFLLAEEALAFVGAE